jgi:glutathione-regulated potassium-efflux system protein KefB
VVADWAWVLGGLAAFMSAKMVAVYAVARIRQKHGEGLLRAALMGEGGEFAFVLYSTAFAAGLFDARTAAILSAIVILSMALTPLRVMLADRLRPKETVSMDGIDHAADLRERVLIIGFGRFAQVVSQPLLTRDIDVSIIDHDVEMIQAAGNFGFKVYYGVEYQLRETFESALVFGHQVLIDLGFSDAEARETIEEVRRRDEERLTLQLSGGAQAGRALMRGNVVTPQPAPYIKPRREGQALNEEAAEALEGEGDRQKAGA